MATDTDPLFRALAEDADRARLEPPADLRRRGDRRTAVRAAAASLAVVAVVAGVMVGASSLADHSSAPDVVDSPTPSPTATPSKPTPTRIPASAWLDGADLNDSEDLGETDGRLPGCRLRVDQEGGAVARLALRGLRFGFYRAPDLTLDYVPDGTVYQQIRVYDAGDAELQHFMGCSTAPGDLGNASIAGAPDLVQLMWVRQDKVSTWFAVIHVHDVFSVLALQGWEGTSASEEDARRLAAAAATRLHAWLD